MPSRYPNVTGREFNSRSGPLLGILHNPVQFVEVKLRLVMKPGVRTCQGEYGEALSMAESPRKSETRFNQSPNQVVLKPLTLDS